MSLEQLLIGLNIVDIVRNHQFNKHMKIKFSSEILLEIFKRVKLIYLYFDWEITTIQN